MEPFAKVKISKKPPYVVKYEPYYHISRNIFEETILLDFESEKLLELKEQLETNKDFKSILQSSKSMNSYFQSFILNDDSELLRYLNMFKYSVDSTVKGVLNLCNSLKSLKLCEAFRELNTSSNSPSASDFSNSEVNKFFSRSNLIRIVGKDIYNRPVIYIDLTSLKILKKIRDVNANLLKFLIWFYQFSLKSCFSPGGTEQSIIVIDIEGFSNKDLFDNYEDMSRVIQMLFPSRVAKVLIKFTSQIYYSNFLLLKDSFLQYLLERTSIYDKEKDNLNIIETESITTPISNSHKFEEKSEDDKFKFDLVLESQKSNTVRAPIKSDHKNIRDTKDYRDTKEYSNKRSRLYPNELNPKSLSINTSSINFSMNGRSSHLNSVKNMKPYQFEGPSLSIDRSIKFSIKKHHESSQRLSDLRESTAKRGNKVYVVLENKSREGMCCGNSCLIC